MNSDHARSPLEMACVLDRSTLKFLEEHGLLGKLKEERIKFVESKKRGIDNSHMDVLHNAIQHRRAQSDKHIASKVAV